MKIKLKEIPSKVYRPGMLRIAHMDANQYKLFKLKHQAGSKPDFNLGHTPGTSLPALCCGALEKRVTSIYNNCEARPKSSILRENGMEKSNKSMDPSYISQADLLT
ncbi:hypothetical protein SFRURICE_012203 [Spodoptera frugiperda]|nr:hypothetical protein SFRURICE_012203 [Spodoptera frugiperda]